MVIAKDSSTSFSNRFSVNGLNNTLNITHVGSSSNSISSNSVLSSSSNNTSTSSVNTIPSSHHHHYAPNHPHPTSAAGREYSIDLEALSSNNSSNRKKSRTPSPPLSSPEHRITFPFPILKRSSRWSKKNKKPCLLVAVVAIGLLVPVWIIATGIITLESFNDMIRYLPGYHIFANNLLYLVMFLLLASFTILATLPILPIFILALPFHLLIFSIFNKLMSEWLWWCVGCYTVLSLAPVGSTVVSRIKNSFYQPHQRGSQREPLIRQKLPPSLALPQVNCKYSPLYPGILKQDTWVGQVCARVKMHLEDIGRRMETVLQLFSVSANPRTSIRWRLTLALLFWFSYVIPVTLNNESRVFDPAQSAASFDIAHPEFLCSASGVGVQRPRHGAFEGYWKEYLQFHKQMVLPEEAGGIPQDQKRFLIFQPSDDGLGNRLQALLSAVVMAMISHRAIILDWQATPQCNANFTDLFQQPEGLAWDLNTTLPDHEDLPAYKSKYDIWYPYCRNCAIRSPITPESTWSPLLCDRDLGLDPSTPIVQVLSTQWFLPVLQHNAHWRSLLCEILPEGGKTAFRDLASILLKPSRVVQDKVNSVLDRIPEDATLIGLQVRRTENNAVGQGIENSFLRCAAEAVEEEEAKTAVIARSEWRGVTGSGRDFVRNRLRRGFENLQEEGDEGSMTVQQDRTLDQNVSAPIQDHVQPQTKPRFAYFLATDYRPTRAHFQSVLGDELYVLENTFRSQKSDAPVMAPKTELDTENGISEQEAHHRISSQNAAVRVDSLSRPDSSSDTKAAPQTEAVVRNSVQGVQTAVAEMFLLAHADRIVSSPYSTFGYFAHAYANVQPNIVKRDGTCIKRRSTQPCFQYWFGFANGGAKCSVKATVEMSEDYDCWL
ncbi:hypothetical protein BGZ70_002824 [Mortierella alpina]|uniref:Uncharacterized protein n=1 Tax=Mortierella alpina TaxID=64518 RepID=A0A9P6M4N2_MORAP|nr:hypothetical protein BGZ70_002824 [Mortierella alpina]